MLPNSLKTLLIIFLFLVNLSKPECPLENCFECSSPTTCRICKSGFQKESSFSSTGLKYDICSPQTSASWMIATILGILSVLLTFTLCYLGYILKEKYFPKKVKNSSISEKYKKNSDMRYLDTVASTARNMKQKSSNLDEESRVLPFEPTPIPEKIEKKVLKINGRFRSKNNENSFPRQNPPRLPQRYSYKVNQEPSYVWNKLPNPYNNSSFGIYKEGSLNYELNRDSVDPCLKNSDGNLILHSFGNGGRVVKKETNGLKKTQVRVPFREIISEEERGIEERRVTRLSRKEERIAKNLKNIKKVNLPPLRSTKHVSKTLRNSARGKKFINFC